jgi:hypothetical protein
MSILGIVTTTFPFFPLLRKIDPFLMNFLSSLRRIPP